MSLKKSFMGLGIPTVYANVYKHGSTKKAILDAKTIGPFIRGKIRRVLNKTRSVPFIRACLIYLIRRVLAKPRLILDEMCLLYGKFASYLRRFLFFLV